MKQIWFKPPYFRQFSLDEDGRVPRLTLRRMSCETRAGKDSGRPEAKRPRVRAFRPGTFVCVRRVRGGRSTQADMPRVRRSAWLRFTRALSRGIDKYGYYAAVGICALMVFVGAAAGVMGYGGLEERATPAPSPAAGIADEHTGDVSAAQASAGGGLLEGESDADERRPALALWPVEGEVLTGHETGRLIYLKTLGLYGTHAGIDIAGERGQVVVACADGEIARCWRESLLGNVVEVRGDDNVVTRYANLMSLELAKEGTRVKAGDAIGAIGQSAMSESLMDEHLHFEVLVDGESVPPLEWLP